MGNFAQIPNYWTSFSVEPEEFIDAGEYVVVSGTQRAGNDKGSFEAPFVHVLEVQRRRQGGARRVLPTAPRRRSSLDWGASGMSNVDIARAAYEAFGRGDLEP